MDTNDLPLIICRLCLNIKTGLEHLFHFENLSDKILILIMECTTVKVDLNDGYSNFICTNCLDLLKKFHDFRTMCFKSDLILKNYRGIVNKIEFVNYLEKCKNNDLKLKSEMNDVEIFIKDETNNVDVDSLNNDSQLSDAVELDFIDNSEQTFITDKCNSIESLHENNLDNSLIEKKCMENLITKTKLSTRLKSEQKEPRNSKRRKQNKELRICYICGKLTFHFSTHLKTHKTVRDWKCEKCGKMFTNRAAVRKHQYVHDPNSSHVCEKCGTACVTKQTLARHIRTVHFPTRRYECSVCLRRFENAYNLKVHKMKHSGEYRYKCKYCSESFTSHAEFREHNFNKHNVPPPKVFKCEKCNLTFLYRSHLAAHKKRPEHKALKKRPEHKAHKKRPGNKAGKIFECTKCNKRFHRPKMYQKHTKLKHVVENETKAIDLKCNVCNKTFKQLKYLNQHEKLHTENGKKFKCEICDKRFFYNAFLKEHIRVHTGERPAKCDFCNNAYISVRQLRKHIKSHQTISS